MASRLELSPELVLVSPDLAEVARAALPDRPWEAFIPRATGPPPAPAEAPAAVPVAAAPAVSPAVAAAVALPAVAAPAPALRRVVRVPPPLGSPPLPAPAPAPTRPARDERRHDRRQRGWRAIALTMIGLAALAVASSRPVPDAPTFAAERPNGSETAQPVEAPKSGHAPTGAAAAPTSGPARSRPGAGTSPDASATRKTKDLETPSPPPPPATGRGGAVPGAGYVFGADGRLVVALDGRTISRFEGTTACGTSVVFDSIALSRAGRFSARRTFARKGSAAIVVEVSGYVAAPGLIRGSLSVVAPRCSTPVRRYDARLS